MSGSSDGLPASIHIPLCSDKKCKEQITLLRTALTDEGVKCVTEYKVYGKYKTWFEESFVKCDFTIVHQCPLLWKQIKLCQEVLSNEMKVIAVELIGENDTDIKDNDANADPELVDFFHGRMIQTITDDESRERFVRQIISALEETCPGYIPSSAKSETSTSSAYNVPSATSPSSASSTQEKESDNCSEKSDVEDDEEVEVETFELYPDIFGERKLAVSVRSKVLQYSDVVTISHASIEDCMKMGLQIDNFKAMSNEQLMSNTKYVLYEVLPSLYKNNCILGLTIIAGCNQPVLQKRALTLVELMLLERRGPEENMDFAALLEVESTMSITISDLHKKFADSKERGVLMTIRRLTNAYLMLLCEMIVPSTHGLDMQKCDMHIRAISGRPLAGAKKNRSTGHLSTVDNFVGEIKSRSCKSVRKFLVDFLSKENDPLKQAKDLPGKNIAYQTIIVFEHLKKVFRNFDRTSLDFLEIYVQPTKRYFVSKEAHMTCITMLFRSLTLFLSYGLRKDTNDDLQHLCNKAMDVITHASQRELPNEVGRLMQTLLCNKEPVIRRGIRKVFHDRNNDNMVSYLLHEVEKELCPILTLDRSKEPQMLRYPSQWIVAPAHFNSKPALVHIFQSNEESAMHENIHHVDLRRLQHLQHKNIIQLFAYQKTRALCYYIVENYQHNNLQTALKNRNVRQAFFTKSQLYGFLVDACLALEYCHSKGYVHRNLTAASCFLTTGNTVKLCGFHICLRLVSAERKAVEQNSPGIPTRWSAPESLSRDEYTPASDVWMVGHLIFEVLTHGLLPYSHVKKSDSEIVQLIIKDQANLFQEPCIEPRSYDVIVQCTQNDPEHRPSVSEIKCKLEDFLGTANDESIVAFPDLTSGSKKPSTEHKLGNPGYKRLAFKSNPEGHNEKLSIVRVSNTMIQLKLKDRYIFKEKIPRKLPNEMLVTLRSGELNNILPPIRVFKNSDESQHIECSITLNCLGNLLDLTVERALGHSVAPYIRCLYEVAAILESLNTANCILGDMCASNLFIEQKGSAYKVHVVSLACLCDLKNPYQDAKLPTPTNVEVIRRTAPEVLSHSLYSPSSDVFCFGILMWEVLTAYDQDQDYFTELYAGQYDYNDLDDVHEHIVAGDWEKLHHKPDCCSDSLWELIKLCVHVSYSRRPTIPHLVKLLKTYCTQDLGLTFSEVPTESEPGFPLFSTSNPSVPSDATSSVGFMERNASSVGSVSEMDLSDYEIRSSMKDNALLRDLMGSCLLLTQSPGSVDSSFTIRNPSVASGYTNKAGDYLAPKNISLDADEESVVSPYEDIDMPGSPTVKRSSRLLPPPPLPPDDLEIYSIEDDSTSNSKKFRKFSDDYLDVQYGIYELNDLENNQPAPSLPPRKHSDQSLNDEDCIYDDCEEKSSENKKPIPKRIPPAPQIPLPPIPTRQPIPPPPTQTQQSESPPPRPLPSTRPQPPSRRPPPPSSKPEATGQANEEEELYDDFVYEIHSKETEKPQKSKSVPPALPSQPPPQSTKPQSADQPNADELIYDDCDYETNSKDAEKPQKPKSIPPAPPRSLLPQQPPPLPPSGPPSADQADEDETHFKEVDKPPPPPPSSSTPPTPPQTLPPTQELPNTQGLNKKTKEGAESAVGKLPTHLLNLFAKDEKSAKPPPPPKPKKL